MIRKAKIEDYISICQLATDLHNIHYQLRPDIYQKVESVVDIQTYQQLIENQEILVFEKQNEILGYVQIEIKQRGNALEKEAIIFFIHYLMIKKEKQRQGIGTQFFQELEKYAKKKKCMQIELFAIPENKTANIFYQELGMKVQTIKYEKKI